MKPQQKWWSVCISNGEVEQVGANYVPPSIAYIKVQGETKDQARQSAGRIHAARKERGTDIAGAVRLTLPEELEETIESALATWQDVSLHQGPPTNHDQINREAALTEYLVKAREQARELPGLLKAAGSSLRRVL